MSKKLLRKKLALMLSNLKRKRPFYTEVEYLQSSGTQYIDTGLYFDVTKNFEVNAVIMNFDNKRKVIIGDFTVDTIQSYSLEFGGTQNNKPQYLRTYINFRSPQDVERNLWSSSQLSLNTVYTINQKWVASTKYEEMTYNGTTDTVTRTVEPNIAVNTNTLKLFLDNRDNITAIANPLRIYKLQIIQNNVLVRDFIPVLDWDYVPCMYDKVTGQLFYNQGTGDFTYGREIHYVEYLESDSTAYIDTGVSGANNNFKIEMGFSYSKFYAYGYFFSNYESESANVTRFCLNWGDTNWGLAYINTKSQDGSIYTSIFSKDTFHTFILTKTSVSIDGSIRTNNNPPVGTANTKNIILFNRGTGTYYEKRDIGMRCYYFRIYDGTTLARDFIPAIDENGVGFMFDRVTHTIFDNAGTGAFSYPAREIEYLESTGTQYIDIGLKGKNGYDFEYKVNFTRVGTTAYAVGGIYESQKSCYLGMVRTHSKFSYHYQNTQSPIEIQTVSANTDYTIKGHLYSGSQYFDINNVVGGNGTISGDFESTNNMWLFGLNSSSPLYSYIKLPYCKIKYNGTLVRDYIPAFQDGVAGMLDKVNNVFYTNQGTGSFTAGKVIESRYE